MVLLPAYCRCQSLMMFVFSKELLFYVVFIDNAF